MGYTFVAAVRFDSELFFQHDQEKGNGAIGNESIATRLLRSSRCSLFRGSDRGSCSDLDAFDLLFLPSYSLVHDGPCLKAGLDEPCCPDILCLVHPAWSNNARELPSVDMSFVSARSHRFKNNRSKRHWLAVDYLRLDMVSYELKRPLPVARVVAEEEEEVYPP